jgi:hypothetical protein
MWRGPPLSCRWSALVIILLALMSWAFVVGIGVAVFDP